QSADRGCAAMGERSRRSDDSQPDLLEAHDVIAGAPDLGDAPVRDPEDEHERPRKLGARGGDAAIRTGVRVVGGHPEDDTVAFGDLVLDHDPVWLPGRVDAPRAKRIRSAGSRATRPIPKRTVARPPDSGGAEGASALRSSKRFFFSTSW